MGKIFALVTLLFAVFFVALANTIASDKKDFDNDFLAYEQVNFVDASTGDFDKGIAAYERGEYAAAVWEWTPLAEQGDAKAQFELGLMYRYGLGVGRDYGEAAKWFKLSAEQGNEGGQSNLGSMYQEGLGVPQDYGEAVKWFRMAAERGEAVAQSNLSVSYFKGRGIARNYLEAYKWANIAAAQGAEQAIKIIDALAAKIRPAQIEEANRRIREWDPYSGNELPPKLLEPLEQVSVSDVQALLNFLGYQTGNVDGIVGRRTRAAIREFQLREGMQVNSELTGELVARLENSVRVRTSETVGNQISAVSPTPRRFENSERLGNAKAYIRDVYVDAMENDVAHAFGRNDHADIVAWRIQLVSLTQTDTEKVWNTLRRVNPDLLSSLTLHVQSAELSMGTFSRVQAGPLANRATAASLCNELRSRNQDCLVVSP